MDDDSLWKKRHMGVSKNSGTPKWMVKIMENPIRMDDLGGFKKKQLFLVQHPYWKWRYQILSNINLRSCRPTLADFVDFVKV